MAKFPRRSGTSAARSYVVVGLCLVLALFAISSRSSWLQSSSETEPPHIEGRSLQATTSGSKFSLFSPSAAAAISNDAQGDDVLVMYLYDNRDPVWVDNFKFFVQWGIAADDGCSYIILVNEALYAAKVCRITFVFSACIMWTQLTDCSVQETLPGYGTLPSNAEFVQADTANCAVGLGMLSQALNTTMAKSHSFKHYLFMNSYARGPFLPAYLVVSCTATMRFLASRCRH